MTNLNYEVKIGTVHSKWNFCDVIPYEYCTVMNNELLTIDFPSLINNVKN